MSPQVEVDVDGRQLRLSNLDKVLWPAASFTKGRMIDYYAKVAPVMVPHLMGRPITLRRYPNGVDGQSFFEKNCPSHRPEWVDTVEMGGIGYCSVSDRAALVWMANLAAIEIHPGLARAGRFDLPDFMVFDLDPGPGTDVVTCGQVALLIRNLLDGFALSSWVKTSGSKGLQVYVPLDGQAGYDWTREFSRAVAVSLETAFPRLVVSTQAKAARTGKVLIDWSQNNASKTTVAVYSLRARDRPGASTPVRWSEVEAAVEAGDASLLVFEADAVVARIEADGDLMAPLLDTVQELPDLSSMALRS